MRCFTQEIYKIILPGITNDCALIRIYCLDVLIIIFSIHFCVKYYNKLLPLHLDVHNVGLSFLINEYRRRMRAILSVLIKVN